MRNTLPSGGPRKNESFIVNLQTIQEPGSHWVAVKKRGDTAIYFDSFGNLKPPLELQRYLNKCKILYNHDVFQQYDTYNCGHLCLEFLNKRFEL